MSKSVTWSHMSFLNATYLSAPLHCASEQYKDLKTGERETEVETFTIHTTSKLVLTEEQLWTSVDVFLMVICL